MGDVSEWTDAFGVETIMEGCRRGEDGRAVRRGAERGGWRVREIGEAVVRTGRAATKAGEERGGDMVCLGRW